MAADDDADSATTALVPAASQRVLRLRKQHGALVAKVRHKRAALVRMREEADVIGPELANRAASIRARHRQDDERVHQAFEAIGRDSRLDRCERSGARVLYQWLQAAGVLSQGAIDPRGDTDLEPARAEQARVATMRPTFLRLASEFHPDKTADEGLRARYTEIMKDLNQAYRGGDVSRLLELERAFDDGASIVAQPTDATLESQVVALRAQLRELSREMSGLRTRFEGAIVIEFRRLTDAGIADPIGAIVQALSQGAAQLGHLLALVERFRDGDLDLETLLDSPASDGIPDDSWLTDVFAEARRAIGARPKSRRPGRHRPR